MNRLANERSAYLRHAKDQEIDWRPWSEEAFEEARLQDKPVFLSSGAQWCHWCHVMARECFDNEEVAALLNERYIAIKLDRDERPDVDKRYQRAVAAMGLGGGWPLSVFLTPDKKPFYGGTYFPPEEAYGRPGFKTILLTLSNLYREKKEEILAQSAKLLDLLKEKPPALGEIKESAVEEGVGLIVSGYDSTHGGFGGAPKFPMSGALELLLNRFFLTRDASYGAVARETLFNMAQGGMHDQLGGGFHRYSTDEAWIIPHFEKMADDNAWLLRNYADAYAVFQEPYFKEVAAGIVGWFLSDLSDPRGGFYASQDADVTPEDEGGFFTWTDDELKAVLDDEEYKVLSLRLAGPKGRMHHDRAKHVLYVARTVTEIGKALGLPSPSVEKIVERGKKKLLEARNGRSRPYVDTALYTSLNGLAIAAFIKAYRFLNIGDAADFAFKSIDRVLEKNVHDGRLLHCEGVPALLDDYVFFSWGLIEAYEATGRKEYLDRAAHFMEAAIAECGDEVGGGFFDTAGEVLGIRLKGVEDIPHPSANAVAIPVLMKLGFMRDDQRYRTAAVKALQAFSLQAQYMGAHGAYYLCALDAYFNMWELTFNLSPDGEYARAARSIFAPYQAIKYGPDLGNVSPCRAEVCLEPVANVKELEALLASGPRGSRP